MDEQKTNNEKTGQSPQGNAQATTERQELNAMLAQLAKGGNSTALAQLWELNRPVLRSMFWRWYEQNRRVADAAGLTLEDFEQEGYFAVQRAAENYDPERGSFLSLLQYHVQNRIRTATSGGHLRIATAEDGKQVQVAADPLNTAASLDETIMGDSGDEIGARGDMIPDPAAVQAFEDAERRVYVQQLHGVLEDALNGLPERQACAIRSRYYERATLRQCAEAEGVTQERARQIINKGLHTLRTCAKLCPWIEEYREQLYAKAYRGTSFSAWKHSGSIEERLVEQMEERQRAASTKNLAAMLGYAPGELADLINARAQGANGTKCNTHARAL